MWTKIEDLKNIELSALPVQDDRYITTKIRTHDDKFYTNFRCLNFPKDFTEFEYVTVTSIDSLLVHKTRYCMQVYLENCAYKIVDKQMASW